MSVSLRHSLSSKACASVKNAANTKRKALCFQGFARTRICECFGRYRVLKPPLNENVGYMRQMVSPLVAESFRRVEPSAAFNFAGQRRDLVNRRKQTFAKCGNGYLRVICDDQGGNA